MSSPEVFNEFMSRFKIIDREDQTIRKNGCRYLLTYARYYKSASSDSNDLGDFQFSITTCPFATLSEAEKWYVKYLRRAYEVILSYNEDNCRKYYKSINGSIITQNQNIDKLLVVNYDKIVTKLTKFLRQDDDEIEELIPVVVEPAPIKKPQQQQKRRIIYHNNDEDAFLDD